MDVPLSITNIPYSSTMTAFLPPSHFNWYRHCTTTNINATGFPVKMSPLRRPRTIILPLCKPFHHCTTIRTTTPEDDAIISTSPLPFQTSTSITKTTRTSTTIFSTTINERTTSRTWIIGNTNPNQHCNNFNNNCLTISPCGIRYTTSMATGDPSSSSGYQPSEDDRGESSSDTPLELSLAQQLLLKQYASQIEKMSTSECQKLAVDIARQMMAKGPFVSFCFLLFSFGSPFPPLSPPKRMRRVLTPVFKP